MPPVVADPTSSPPSQRVLDEIDTWDAEHATAVVLDRTGVLATHGDLGHAFGVASLTKLATSLAVLVAIEEGATALDAPAGPPGATVRHLLCHASGLDFDSEQVLASPGARRIYSNTGYEQLAEHVARRAGMTFGDYLHEAVLAPLDMRGSKLRGSPAKDLVCTAADLTRFASELLSPTLVHHSTWADATSPQFPRLSGVLPGWGRQDPCPWGLGPELRGTKTPHWTGATAGADTFGHFGRSGAFLWVDPGRGLCCVLLTDRTFGEWAVAAWPGFSDLVRHTFT